jgi:ankyrin repeat protein
MAGQGEEEEKTRGKDLLFACLRNDEKKFFELVKTVDVNFRNLHGETPLFFAARSSPMLAQVLLDKGADPAARTHSNQSILHQIAISGNLEFFNNIKGRPEIKKLVAGELRAWDGLSPMHLSAM